MGFSAVSAIIINFFRNLLNLSYNYPRIDNLLLWFSRFYILLIFVYFYDSLFYPDSEIYKDLVKYPRSIFGVGTVPIFLSFIPVFIASLISIIISLILWNRGDKSSKYLFITFLIPFAGALIYFFVDECTDTVHIAEDIYDRTHEEIEDSLSNLMSVYTSNKIKSIFKTSLFLISF